MVELQSFRDWSALKFIRKSVGKNLSRFVGKLPIFLYQRRSPKPAFAKMGGVFWYRPILVDLAPKSIDDRQFVAHSLPRTALRLDLDGMEAIGLCHPASTDRIRYSF